MLFRNIAPVFRSSFLIALILGTVNLSANPSEDFQKGNTAFEAGKFADAIPVYENIIKTGQSSVEVYFNLGNAYFKTGNLGKSILNYERAYKLSNGNRDVKKNLEIVRAQLKDEIIPLPPFFVAQFFSNIINLNSSTGWAILSLLFLWLGFTILSMKILGKKLPILENVARPSALFSISLGILFFILAFAKNANDFSKKELIVLAKKTELKEGADRSSPKIITLHEGTKSEMLDQIGDWFKIRLADGEEGWISQLDVEII